MEKYIGTTVDGYWKVIDRKENEKRYTKYTLQNELNGTTVVVGSNVFYRIAKGETSVSSVIRSRIKGGFNFSRRKI